jgi:hypothetical protein
MTSYVKKTCYSCLGFISKHKEKRREKKKREKNNKKKGTRKRREKKEEEKKSEENSRTHGMIYQPVHIRRNSLVNTIADEDDNEERVEL